MIRITFANIFIVLTSTAMFATGPIPRPISPQDAALEPVEVEFATDSAVLRGRVFLPRGSADVPGVMILGGSERGPQTNMTTRLARIFADQPVSGSDNDLLHLLDHVRADEIPPLYVACGSSDFLLEDNTRFVNAARDAGVDVEAVFDDGDHNWAYWDRHIRQVVSRLPLRHRAPGT